MSLQDGITKHFNTINKVENITYFGNFKSRYILRKVPGCAWVERFVIRGNNRWAVLCPSLHCQKILTFYYSVHDLKFPTV